MVQAGWGGRDVHPEGLLHRAGPFNVWFQDLGRSLADADTERTGRNTICDGRIALESTLDAGIGQPRDLPKFPRRLLSPRTEEGEDWYGHIFSAYLPLDFLETLTVRFGDTTYWGRESSFVECDGLEEPFAIVSRDSCRLFGEPREEFELITRLQSGWSLARE
ncbi:MAG: hypothetical protein GTO63_22360 [Anaerolineae bacterium]|nr:hypothetical protein [Anaerolineae bacterium]